MKNFDFPHSNRARTSFIRDSLWFAFDSKSNQWNHKKKMIHDSPYFDFWFDFILIRRWIMIRGKSWVAANQNQISSKGLKATWIERIESESNWIRIKNKMIRKCESKWIDSVRALAAVSMSIRELSISESLERSTFTSGTSGERQKSYLGRLSGRRNTWDSVMTVSVFEGWVFSIFSSF